MKKEVKTFEQCQATYDGMRCEQDINHHYKQGRALKHNYKGSWWTESGVEAEMKRQHKQWLKEEGL
jgi:hypothetical protein